MYGPKPLPINIMVLASLCHHSVANLNKILVILQAARVWPGFGLKAQGFKGLGF